MPIRWHVANRLALSFYDTAKEELVFVYYFIFLQALAAM